MPAALALDKQINYYLAHLSTEQKKVVLSVVKTIAHEEEPLWDDKSFIAEMDRRFAEMESGKVKLHSLDEAEAIARQSYRNRKQKK